MEIYYLYLIIAANNQEIFTITFSNESLTNFNKLDKTNQVDKVLILLKIMNAGIKAKNLLVFTILN